MAHIPATADAIDAGWLSGALAPRHPGVRVRAVEVTSRQEWTNAHAWQHIDYDEAAGAPDTLFCKLLPADPARRGAIAATGMGLREALFYERLAPRLALRTPVAHAVRHDAASGAFVMLLEDLAASACTVSDGPTGIPPAGAARALADLAELHLRFEHAARRAAEADWVPPPPASDNDYGARMLRYGLDNHRDRLSDRFAGLAELYIAERAALHALWSGGPGPLTVIHGDAHIGNLFMDRDRIGFYDWGMVQQGRGLRDVSYFLTMSLTPGDRRRTRSPAAAPLPGRARGTRRRTARLRGRVAGASPVRLLRRRLLLPVVTFPQDATPKRRVFAESLLARAVAAIAELRVRERGGLRRAEESYRTTVRLKPNHAQGHLILGLVLMDTGRLEEALAEFERADASLPEYPEARINRANALRLLGRSEDAIPFYQQALAIEPDAVEALVGLAGAYVETGDAARGEALLRETIARNPKIAPPRLALAILLDRNGRKAEAETQYREILEIDPSNEKVRRRLAQRMLTDP